MHLDSNRIIDLHLVQVGPIFIFLFFLPCDMMKDDSV